MLKQACSGRYSGSLKLSSRRFKHAQNWSTPFLILFSIAPEIYSLGWYSVVIHAKFGISRIFSTINHMRVPFLPGVLTVNLMTSLCGMGGQVELKSTCVICIAFVLFFCIPTRCLHSPRWCGDYIKTVEPLSLRYQLIMIPLQVWECKLYMLLCKYLLFIRFLRHSTKLQCAWTASHSRCGWHNQVLGYFGKKFMLWLNIDDESMVFVLG